MKELIEAWRLIAAEPVESACALGALIAFLGVTLMGLPLIAVGLGWAG
jgi:hypothetical protein